MGDGAPSPLLHLLLFSSTVLLVVAQTGFISIDCGAVEGWVDSQTGIQWVPDGNYTDSGVNAKVGNASLSELLRTLRYFPNSSISNCYVWPVSAGQKYFFRALFYYGNYDGKGSWPSFFLSFDGGNWTYEIIGTDYSLDESANAEVMFTPLQSSINLCLTSKDFVNNVPFISSLELRPLPTAFYDQETDFKDSYLHVVRRTYFNEDETAVVRYPQDPNDRKWYPRSFVPDHANRISSNVSFDTSGLSNEPPAEVMMTGLEGIMGSVFNYTLDFGRIDSDLLFYFYFWELRANRTASDVREFNIVISVDNGHKSSPLTMTIEPNDTWVPYYFGGGLGLSDKAVVAFSLTPTSSSTLPPILNAFEIFKYNEPTVTLPPSPSPPPPPPPPPPAQKKNSSVGVGAIVGIALAGGLLSLICLLLIVFWCRPRKLPPDNQPHIGLTSIGPIQYSYSDIQKMTDDFKHKIGDGGFADVYKGFTMTGMQLAVKVIKATGNQARDFNREISVLSVIHHFNLVDFVGYCAEGTKMILVYKFMQNSSLDRWIFNNSANPLSWEKRFNIITGVASGLTYLHEQCGNIVLHLDLKPQNILLDEKFIPKVADFGISKLLDRDQSMIFTQTIRGSPLYIPPEMFMGAGLNTKMDVYSFGIIMLEIVAGRRIIDLSGSTLAEVVSDIKNKDFFPVELVDTAIRASVDEIEAKRVIQIVFLCLLAPAERPAMSSVLLMLQGRIPIQALSAAQEANLKECLASKCSPLAFAGAPLMSYSNSKSYEAESTLTSGR